MRTRTAAAISLVAGLAPLAACSSTGATPGATGTTAAGGGTTSSSHASSSSSSSGSGGTGGTGGGCVDMGPATTTFVPTPADIQFQAGAAVPLGEQILFNDWNPNPNTLSSVTPDGVTTTKVLAAYRVWSVGVSHGGATIAFACGDPQQQAHYKLDLGDAIQHTWLYDVATQKASLLTDGNVNDECHAFGPGDTAIYLCRRYDFTSCFANKGYRLGRVDLPGGAFTFLTPDDPSTMALDPQPTPDGASLLFRTQIIKAGSPENDIQEQALPAGTPTQIRPKASTPVLSPDGTRYVYANDADGRKLWVTKLDGTQMVRIAGTPGDSATWSPDGTRVAYLRSDTSANCNHIEIVQADGSTASTPARIRDCGTSGEYITTLNWFKR